MSKERGLTGPLNPRGKRSRGQRFSSLPAPDKARSLLECVLASSPSGNGKSSLSVEEPSRGRFAGWMALRPRPAPSKRSMFSDPKTTMKSTSSSRERRVTDSDFSSSQPTNSIKRPPKRKRTCSVSDPKLGLTRAAAALETSAKRARIDSRDDHRPCVRDEVQTTPSPSVPSNTAPPVVNLSEEVIIPPERFDKVSPSAHVPALLEALSKEPSLRHAGSVPEASSSQQIVVPSASEQHHDDGLDVNFELLSMSDVTALSWEPVSVSQSTIYVPPGVHLLIQKMKQSLALQEKALKRAEQNYLDEMRQRLRLEHELSELRARSERSPQSNETTLQLTHVE